MGAGGGVAGERGEARERTRGRVPRRPRPLVVCGWCPLAQYVMLTDSVSGTAWQARM